MIKFTQHPRLWFRLRWVELCFYAKWCWSRSWLPYPQRYFLRNPILTTIVLWDYRQRRLGLRPDRWHPADLELFTLHNCKKDNENV